MMILERIGAVMRVRDGGLLLVGTVRDSVVGVSLRLLLQCSTPTFGFYGHGGNDTADFACNYLPRFTVEDEAFPGRAGGQFLLHFCKQTPAVLWTYLALDSTALAALVMEGSLYLL